MRIDQTSHQEPILSLTGISKEFPGVRALDGVDFSLLPGEVHALMGENAAGKSTLVNIISGLLHPTSGKICLAPRQLVEIAKALSMEFRIIMMDEPTAALNAAEVARLFEIIERLKRRGIAVLYVSHRLREIFRIADRVTVLGDGKRVDTRRLNDLTEDDVVTMMLGRALKKEEAIYRTIPVSGQAALSVNNITVPGFVTNISFDLHIGEVMGCAGLIGSGRYELTRALFGLLRISSGEVKIKGQPVLLRCASDSISYGIYMLPEERKVEGIFPDLTVRENLLISGKKLFRRLSELFINANEEETQYQEMRKSLEIRASSSGQRITKLSGGNQQKVMLGEP